LYQKYAEEDDEQKGLLAREAAFLMGVRARHDLCELLSYVFL
jgi:hypothetical protein